MSILSDLLNKAPQSVKDKYKIKIREKAIEKVKEKIIKHNKTIDDYSDDEMKEMIRTRFAQNLSSILSMRLLPALGGGRVALYEVLLANQGIRNLIKDSKDHQIESALEQGKSEGMKTFKQSISELLARKRISKETADIYLDQVAK